MKTAEEHATFARKMFADLPVDARRPTLVGMLDSAANRTYPEASDTERLAEIRAYLAEYHRTEQTQAAKS